MKACLDDGTFGCFQPTYQQDPACQPSVSLSFTLALKVIGCTPPTPWHSALFWHQGRLLLRAPTWPVEHCLLPQPPVPFCVGSAAERNSIFQGDDVRSANTAARRIGGESQWRTAEVAGMFWPHIMCCDSRAGDNACTWSIWQGVKYRFTLCAAVVAGWTFRPSEEMEQCHVAADGPSGQDSSSTFGKKKNSKR